MSTLLVKAFSLCTDVVRLNRVRICIHIERSRGQVILGRTNLNSDPVWAVMVQHSGAVAHHCHGVQCHGVQRPHAVDWRSTSVCLRDIANADINVGLRLPANGVVQAKPCRGTYGAARIVYAVQLPEQWVSSP